MTSVLVVPCLPVERPQLREAWRTLVGQGHDKRALSDDVVVELLWKARALPLAVDILSAIDLYAVRFEDSFVEVLAPIPSQTPLTMVAWRRDDELAIEVLVVPTAVMGAAVSSVVDAVAVRVVFTFRLAGVGPNDEDITAEDLKIPNKDRDEPVRLRRFSVGKN